MPDINPAKIPFKALPFSVKLMTCASMFMAWVLFAEFVIDRYGWHEFLPFYRFADICPYEFVVLGLIGVFWWRAHKAR